MRILVIGGHEAGIIADALVQRGIDAVVIGKEEDMGSLNRHSGFSRMALAIAAVLATPVRDVLSLPSFSLESACYPWGGVKDRFSDAVQGHRSSHLPVYRAGFAKHHEAVMTRQFRNPVCRSSCNPTLDV